MQPHSTPVLSLRGASTAYDGRPVLQDIDLDILPAQTVAVMGRSGAGKSTLLKLLYMQRPEAIALVPQARILGRGPLGFSQRLLWTPRPLFHQGEHADAGVAQGAMRLGDPDILCDVGLEAQMYQKAGTLGRAAAKGFACARDLQWPSDPARRRNRSRHSIACRAVIS